MTEWTATVVKTKTEDGYWCAQPGMLSVGQQIPVDFDSRRDVRFINQLSGKEFTCEIVERLDIPQSQDGHFIPTELLEL